LCCLDVTAVGQLQFNAAGRYQRISVYIVNDLHMNMRIGTKYVQTWAFRCTTDLSTHTYVTTQSLIISRYFLKHSTYSPFPLLLLTSSLAFLTTDVLIFVTNT